MISEMEAKRDEFLGGNELPEGALLKTLMVPSGRQGVHDKLKELGKQKCTILPPHLTCN